MKPKKQPILTFRRKRIISSALRSCLYFIISYVISIFTFYYFLDWIFLDHFMSIYGIQGVPMIMRIFVAFILFNIIQWVRHDKNREQLEDNIFKSAIIFYLLSLAVILFFFRESESSQYFSEVNFIPFETITMYLQNPQDSNQNLIFFNVFGNILIFIPFGLILANIFQTKLYLYAVCIIIPTIFEFSQYALKGGIFDIDDIILNSLGILIGIISVKLWSKINGSYKKELTIAMENKKGA